MITELSEREYAQLGMSRCMVRREVHEFLTPAFLSLTHRWMSSMSGSETTVMCFVLAVTLASGRVAREMSIREIANGIRDDDKTEAQGGTGLSENSIRSALKSLAERGFLTIFKEQKSNGNDNAARIYEIDFNRLDPALGAKMGHHTPSTPEGAPFKNCRAQYISNYVTVREEERDTSISIRSDSEVVAAAQPVGEVMAFVGKKTPKPAPQFSSAAEAISSVQGRSRAKVQARATAATAVAPKEISKDQMQALFDAASAGVALPYRIMVTVKEHGFLRKRLAENPPANFRDMVRWSLTYWGVLAQQNRKAVTSDRTRVLRGKSLPEAPHFSTFVYWYPYFMKAYQNHLAGQVIEQREQEQKDEATVRLMDLRRKLDERERDVAILRRRATQGRELAAPAPQPVMHRRVQSRREDDLSPIDLPDWKPAQR